MTKFNKGDTVYRVSPGHKGRVTIDKCVVQSWGAKRATLTNDSGFLKYAVWTEQANMPVVGETGFLRAGDQFFKVDDVTRDFVESVAIECAIAIIDWNVRHYEKCLSKATSEGYRKAVQKDFDNMRREPEIVWNA